MVDTTSRATNPQMSDDFARVYEDTAHRITVPVSIAALDAAGGIGKGTRVLDIAAGAGALSVPAADRGASVLAIDVAPGMVRRLVNKLAIYPDCEAREMDGEALDLPDLAFDRTFSIFGTMTFTDWRKGLREQVRVTSAGGKGCVAVWKKPPGAGPFQVLISALGEVFPDRAAPAWPEGFVTLSDPARLRAELEQVGFVNVTVTEIDGVWEGPVGERYLTEMQELHRYVRPYAALEEETRVKVDEAIRRLTISKSQNGTMRLLTPVLIAVGIRP